MSAPLSAQEVELPPFDSFSYLNNALFNPVRAKIAPKAVIEQSPVKKDKTGEDQVVSNEAQQLPDSQYGQPQMPASQQADPQPAIVPVAAVDCPARDAVTASSGLDEFETRLAIDKALSQILKLTVDYGALRNRISGLCQRPATGENSWLTSADGSITGERQLEALQAVNKKQLDERDKQIKLLQTRLDAVQKRYDNENVARLLSEKRLKIARDGVKRNNANVAKTNRKLQVLAEQLEQNQGTIRQLKIDLTDAQLALYKQDQGSQLVPTDGEAPRPSSPAVLEANPGDMTEEAGFAKAAEEWVVEGLQFEEGIADIKLASTANLDKLLDYLEQNPAVHIQINGYTDSIGSAASNLKLSQARAEAVAHYLQQKGANKFQIKVLGYGERRPLADNSSETGRQKNRRVAILFLP